jgi:hypothetical protein
VVASRPIRRILYLTLRPSDGHPSRLTITRPLLRPTRGSSGRAAHPLCSALLRVGFVEPLESPPALVRSYRTVSPLPVRPSRPEGRASRHRRFVLCGTFLRVTPTGCYPAPCPVESGRSSDGSPCGPVRGHPADSPPAPFSRVWAGRVAGDAQLTPGPGRLWVERDAGRLPTNISGGCAHGIVDQVA